MSTKSLFALIYFVIGIIYCIYYWFKYYNHDYKKLKMSGEVEDGMVSNLMISIIILWPICFLLDIFRIIEDFFKKIKN